MPVTVSNSWSSSAWNSSSRGSVSRICSRALPSWLAGDSPARSTILRTLSRSSGIERAAAIGERREEAEKDANADDVAVCVEPAHPDRVHVSGPVNRRAAVRFGDDQQLAAAHEILHVGRQRREVAQPAEDGVRLVAQNAERPVFGFGGSVEKVFAVAEKRKVVVVEPAQEILNFGEFGGGHRRRPRRQFGADLAQDLAHRLPVGHRSADIGEDTRQCLRQPGEVRRIRFGRDLDLHPRFACPSPRRARESRRAARPGRGPPSRSDG